MKRARLLVLCALVAGSASAASPHWEYAGAHGPGHWAQLSPEYASCSMGRHQSPINIDTRGARKEAALPDLSFHYAAVPLRLVNNGHTVQVDAPEGGTLSVGEHRYELAQFHLHTPSEERINGKAYELVVHLVHRDDEGRLAVVAVLFKRGKENTALEPVLHNMPIAAGPQHTVEGTALDPSGLLPARLGYYHFEGSLTTPPCTEGVAWYVLSTPVEASAAQLRLLHTLYSHNARPVQPLNDRAVVQHGT
jgi:carbonic anhydrase